MNQYGDQNKNPYWNTLPKQECTGIIHVVKPGDTLYMIGKKHNVSVSALMYANPYVNIYNLQVGDELCVPVYQRQEEAQKEMGNEMKNEMKNEMQRPVTSLLESGEPMAEKKTADSNPGMEQPIQGMQIKESRLPYEISDDDEL